MGAYIKFEDVRLRLGGKVRFTEDEEDENKMSIKLANRLIVEAEGEVSYDFSPRYASPLVHKDTGTFKDLPDEPTKNLIRTLCELKAVIRILETDFGSGSAIEASKYIDKLQKRYDHILISSVLRKVSEKEDTKQWANPPLPGLKLNYFNTEADDGYAGMCFNTTQHDGSYPAKQINDPSENYWNGTIDDDGE